MDNDPFTGKLDPEAMQKTVERLKAEGRMPTPEKIQQVMAEARREWQEKKRKPRPSSK